nr:MarR family transcriptional regulator [uncultured Agathobaculum sp.]
MELSLHYLLMANHSMLQKLVLSKTKELGLTSGQPKVLDYLQDNDGAMQKDIAQGCHIEPSSLSTILNGMEKAGLIERKTPGENRRTTCIYLTDEGRARCTELNEIFASAEQQALDGLSPAARHAVRALLAQIYNNLQSGEMK